MFMCYTHTELFKSMRTAAVRRGTGGPRWAARRRSQKVGAGEGLFVLLRHVPVIRRTSQSAYRQVGLFGNISLDF